MLRTHVDNTNEVFGARCSLASVAVNSFTSRDKDSEHMNIYGARDIIKADWPFEVSSIDMEYATGITVTFKDGSVLSVGCWAE